MNVQRVNGRCRVQHRVERGQDRAEHNRREEAQNRLGHYFSNQHRVCGVAVAPILTRISQRADNARNNDDQRGHDLEETCKYGALLRFLQVLRAESTLDDGLVGRPVIHIVDQQAGQQQRPRQPRLGRIDFVDRVQVCRIGVQELVHAVHEAAVAAELAGQEHQAEHRHQQAAYDQAQAVDRVGQGDRLQAAEDRIDRADDRGRDTYDRDRSEIGDTQHLIQSEDIDEHLSARVQDVRQHDDNIAEQNDDGYQTAGAGIIALFKELRDGRQAGL